MLFNPQTGKRFDEEKPLRVKITDVDIPFGSVLGLMIKIALAAVPAAIIMFLVYYVIARLLVAP